MIRKIYSAAISGLSAALVEIETDISSGLPATIIVGLPDAAIRESRERIKSAIKHSGQQFPKSRIAINLAPADLPKIGAHYDLPIAVSVLLASGELEFDPNKKLFVGELALDGGVRPVPGILVIAEAAKSLGFDTVFVPAENALEASLITDLQVVPVSDLANLLKMLTGFSPMRSFDNTEWSYQGVANDSPWDFRLIRGQELAKRALEIAASGGHNVLMSGPPGSGKTLLAKALGTILPPLNYQESLDVTKIYSIAGLLPGKQGLVYDRPFRSPHHTASSVALVGGGTDPRPGEITLAHRGVLFLDEFPEFHRDVLESLRQPLEDGIVNVARASRSMSFPAKFMLVAAKNPCPCGYAGDGVKNCTCSPTQIFRYQKKISGPLIDRIDLHVEVPRLSFEKIEDNYPLEDSSAIRLRVEKARQIQHDRFGKTNSEMGIREIKSYCQMDDDARNLLKIAITQHSLSTRAYHRILKLARTIADLAGSKQIQTAGIAEALMFRPKTEL